jgi:Domain of unknown function (DUF5666)
MRPLPVRRWMVLMGVLVLASCGSPQSPARLQVLTPGAAACSAASLTNPAAVNAGLGGTGAPVARGPDPGGIGGTGQVASGTGIGGTGRPLQAATGSGIGGTGSPVVAGESGLGGTGIVGVVTGFASICVNDVEVEYEPSMPVDRDGGSAALSELAVGQLVALQTTGEGDQLRARRIAVIDAAVGPLTSLDAASGRFQVMGQSALALEATDLQGLADGDWVRVSGQRLSSGEIRASRVQRAAPGTAVVTGPYAASGTLGLRIGTTPLTASVVPVGLAEGQEVAARGEWSGERLRVREWVVQPTRAAMGGSREVLLQGYVHAVRGRELQLGYDSLTLGDQLRVDGSDLRALRVDQPVQVRGWVDEQRRVTVERIELRTEGRRGSSPRSSDAGVSSTATGAATGSASGNSDDSTSGSGSSVGDDRGRGRGRGRGGDSGSSGSGSNSGSGGDSGSGRGRGRGGDSGSSGSGSSGSGSSGSGSSGSGSSGSGSGSSGSSSSGSGSSGSGSSGSGSSGGGDSGGDSGRGRGRGRSGRN